MRLESNDLHDDNDSWRTEKLEVNTWHLKDGSNSAEEARIDKIIGEDEIPDQVEAPKFWVIEAVNPNHHQNSLQEVIHMISELECIKYSWGIANWIGAPHFITNSTSMKILITTHTSKWSCMSYFQTDFYL